jgi:hypothetical protein
VSDIETKVDYVGREKKIRKKKYDHLDPVQAEKAEKSAVKLAAIKAAKELKNEDSPWTLVQEILQEVQAARIVADPDSSPPVTQMTEELKDEIKRRYQDDEETRDLLLESVPSARSVRQWVKKEGWEDAVWSKIRADKLFSPAKRSEVIQALQTRAVQKSDMAAKIYLTLSGDYVEKSEVNDKTVDTFREIQKILHKKKSD